MTSGLIQNPHKQYTPEEAQSHGTNVQRIKRMPELKKWLFLRIVALSETVDAGKRLQSQGEYQKAVDEILFRVPTLTLEEIEIVFRRFESGEIECYNRLKIPEIIKHLIAYDAEEAQRVREYRIRETQHQYESDLPRVSKSKEDSFLCLSETDLLTLDAAQKRYDSKKST